VDVDNGYGGLFARSRDANAAFAGMQGKFGAHHFQLNARYDDISHTGSETTGYAGYGYAVTDSFKLIASASTAFNAPPLGYLYSPSYGNPDLKPELSRSFEAGAQYAFSGQLLRAMLFRTRTKDMLIYNPNAGPVDPDYGGRTGLFVADRQRYAIYR
jgi:vitamin B12 transporter